MSKKIKVILGTVLALLFTHLALLVFYDQPRFGLYNSHLEELVTEPYESLILEIFNLP